MLRLHGVLSALFAMVLLGTGMATAVEFAVNTPDALVFHGLAVVPVEGLLPSIGGTLTSMTRDNLAATITLGRKTFRYKSGQTAAWANGRLITLPHAPFRAHGAVYVPLQALVTALGGTAKFAPGGKAFTLKFPGKTPLTITATVRKESIADFTRSEQWDIYTINIDGTHLRRLSYESGNKYNIAISSDGKTLFYDQGDRLHWRNVTANIPVAMTGNMDPQQYTGWNLRHTVPLADGTVYFTKDARYDGDLPRGLYRRNIVGEATTLIDSHGSSPQFSADGHTLAYMTYAYMDLGTVPDDVVPSVVWMHTRDTKAQSLGLGILLDISSDGKKILYLKLTKRHTDPESLSGALAVYTIETKQEVLDKESFWWGFGYSEIAAHLNPAGTKVAYCIQKRNDDDYPQINSGLIITNADFTDKKTLVPDKYYTPTFIPDGTKVAFINGTGELLLIPTTGGKTQTVTQCPLRQFAITPDGKQVLFCTDKAPER